MTETVTKFEPGSTVKQHSIYNGIKQTVLNRCIVKF